MEILRLEDVSYSYQTKYQTIEAVKHVSCTFEQALMYAIVGESGSGKSTLLSLMAGLDLPTGGDILVEGKSLKTLSRDRYRRDTASVVYQSFHLFPLLTAQENVMFPMEMKGIRTGEAAERACRMLARVGLPDKIRKQFPKMMSGGEQQRVAIARALAKNPKLLLCDEPTGALDYTTGKAVLKLLQDTCREKGRTVVVITHNQALTAMADRIITVKSGTVFSMVKNEKIVDIEDIEW